LVERAACRKVAGDGVATRVDREVSEQQSQLLPVMFVR